MRAEAERNQEDGGGLDQRVAVEVMWILFYFIFLRATPVAYGGSQARGPNGAVAAGLHQSSQQHQILNPLSEGPGIEPTTLWFLVGFVFTEPRRDSKPIHFLHKLFFHILSLNNK